MLLWHNKYGYNLHEIKWGKQLWNYFSNKRGYVAILAGNDKTGFITVKSYRVPVRKIMIELPTGYIDKGESPLTAAKREFLEETGMKAKHWKKMGEYYAAPGILDMKCYLFHSSDLKVVTDKIDEEENIIKVGYVNRKVLMKENDLLSKAALILYDNLDHLNT